MAEQTLDVEKCPAANHATGYGCELDLGHAGDHRAFIGASDEHGPIPEHVWPPAPIDMKSAVSALRAVAALCRHAGEPPSSRYAMLDLASALPGLVADSRRLDWLETMVVNVREPTRYGSLDKFWANPADDEMCDGVFPDLRAKIDAELPAPSDRTAQETRDDD